MKELRWILAIALIACGDDERAREEPRAPEARPIEPLACVGEEHTCLLKADGHVFCWGANLDGQLGDGTRQNRWAPVPVVGVRGARHLACGQDHTCAVLGSGAVTCWGSNEHGQLGHGNTDIELGPVAVAGLNDAVEIGLGHDFSCARRRDGSVSCWGDAREGNIPGASDDVTSPRAVDGLAGASALAVGSAHACAIVEGALQCWGGNGFGQLGREGSAMGVAAVAGLSGVTSVALGNGHSCAAHGTSVSCWGYDSYGQLGDGQGEPDRQPAPVEVQGLPGAVTQLALGDASSCARTADGKVFCWGYGGRLGIDDNDNRHVATEVPGLTDVRAIAMRNQHACALTSAGALWCWGGGSNGQLGNGERYSRAPISIFANVAEVAGDAPSLASFPAASDDTPIVPHLAVAREFVCRVVPDGRVRCFGSGQSGAMGNGSQRAIEAASASYVHGITDARQVDAWWEAGCAVRAGGQLACWGTLPVPWDDRALAPSSLPLAIPGVSDAVEVSVGQTMICIRHRTGAVSCMGQNAAGQLGNGANAASSAMVQVQGITDAVEIEAGYSSACARREGGTISCWGFNGNGELGNGTADSSNVPVEVAGIADAIDVSIDYYHACAVHSQGRVSCWGKNDHAQIGNGEPGATPILRPFEVPGIRDAARVSAYQSLTCIVRTTGEAACWGANTWGGAGIGDEPSVERILTPTPVARTTNADVAAFGPYVMYAPGMNFACGLHTSGDISCSGITPIRPASFFGGGARSRAPIAAPSPLPRNAGGG